MRSEAVIYHPFLLKRLGLEDPGDFLEKMQEDPRFPQGSGRTMRMKLVILQELVAGKDVLIVAHGSRRSRDIEVDVRGWCTKVGFTLRRDQLRSVGAINVDIAMRGFGGEVFHDHWEGPGSPPERSRAQPREHQTLWQRFLVWLRRLLLQARSWAPW